MAIPKISIASTIQMSLSAGYTRKNRPISNRRAGDIMPATAKITPITTPFRALHYQPPANKDVPEHAPQAPDPCAVLNPNTGPYMCWRAVSRWGCCVGIIKNDPPDQNADNIPQGSDRA